MKSPLKWAGGKSYLAKRIIELMPSHTHYAEPFFGGGAVLFAKNPEEISETVNDINRELQNFWIMLRSDLFTEINKLLICTPLSEITFNTAKNYIPADNNMLNAWWFFIRYRQSRQALGRDYVTPTRRRRRGMNEQVSAWLSAVEGLPEAHKRLKRVEIRCMDAINFINKYDHENCLFYCDPPYLASTRNCKQYEFEMSDSDHLTLLNTLARIKGKFILSGYPNEMYSTVSHINKWKMISMDIDNKASSKLTKDIKTECLWMNY